MDAVTGMAILLNRSDGWAESDIVILWPSPG